MRVDQLRQCLATIPGDAVVENIVIREPPPKPAKKPTDLMAAWYTTVPAVMILALLPFVTVFDLLAWVPVQAGLMSPDTLSTFGGVGLKYTLGLSAILGCILALREYHRAPWPGANHAADHRP